MGLPFHTVILAASHTRSDWLSDHATLIVGVVGIVFSGFVGPTISAQWSARREREKDHRALIVARREDLRAILDETGTTLGTAVSKLRPLLDAQQAGIPLPPEPVEFLSSLTPLGQRLRLRLPADHDVIRAFHATHQALIALEHAADSADAWEGAVNHFERQRDEYLEAGRMAIQAPIRTEEEI